MMKLTKYLITPLVLMALSTYSFADSFWRCTSSDEANNSWSDSNKYQKTAINLSYDQCKKNSSAPKSCESSHEDCHYFSDGYDTTPMWQCSAIDRYAQAWKSTAYSNIDDAAIGAQVYCKHKSEIPETCFVNMITCTNINSEANR